MEEDHFSINITGFHERSNHLYSQLLIFTNIRDEKAHNQHKIRINIRINRLYHP